MANVKVVLFCFMLNAVLAALLSGMMMLFHFGNTQLVVLSCLVFGTGTSSGAVFITMDATAKYLEGKLKAK